MKLSIISCFWMVLLLILAGCGDGLLTQTPPTIAPARTLPDSAAPGLTAAERSTLLSLEQVDDYPLYRMVYQGEYPAMSWGSNLPLAVDTLGMGSWGCSLFAALGEPGSQLYGRNFDWEYSPALLLFSQPPGRYASVSMVDIAYLGFEGTAAQNLGDQPLENLVPLLGAPWLPFDGLNEMGLAVGMAAVPPGSMRPDPGKATLGSLAIMREILDRAATVSEAVEILSAYNIDFAGGPPIHYLLADRSGDAVLVEYSQGEMRLIPNQDPWHQATNFLVSAADAPSGVCPRYDTLQDQLRHENGRLSRSQAMHLLAQVSQENTQWSIVYSLDRGEIQVVMGQDYQDVYQDQLDMEFP